jgi:hypothetical protein
MAAEPIPEIVQHLEAIMGGQPGVVCSDQQVNVGVRADVASRPRSVAMRLARSVTGAPPLLVSTTGSWLHYGCITPVVAKARPNRFSDALPRTRSGDTSTLEDRSVLVDLDVHGRKLC